MLNLQQHIELLRLELNTLADEHGICHPVVIEKSQQLDELLNEYMKGEFNNA
ncbi:MULTISPECIES: aspartyl-phosphate phosphatase Spo0E family protein [unclassified Paenibacillus]|uniref:aspartyl-phosphate phosphatase Spo0E family protein n=1 Tax=unclassified Paenibacillus TaxID=185978 RepID=UPI00020D7BAF|nr:MULTISPECIES: aspartyl-phosphate phosphatase Spo0E family protein [unclassified Paenibacillus]EGL18572.1 Spo0E like sporulation regulatory protein [Paenibacillus sp. HGF7]EPD80517.1 hypothetical protein HMPREF1207_05623 [Paenibacillus sp. HGH0039]